ncbi:conserved hypothetical protein [Alteromonas sp. 38]|uniref:DUF2855 family protein n=1 Tax=unclassified Alteromonas TaxID=2614992 RepID=UPI0012F23B7C|nr:MULTISPECIES: DUF2855 family protein [unclassified Alteromonas]CAD5253315.1 conserved hypothetical protein [Alteromonas sp. 154]VXB09789.1 conserved hypothetical protein [Alteromonas sp. 38]
MQQFQVDKQDLSQHRIVSIEHADLYKQAPLKDAPLKEEQSKEGVTFEVERFAFTANNLTYFMMGEKLGYWQFFPAVSGDATSNKPLENNANDKWGVIPVWGIGKVSASSVEGVDVGSRYFGYFPPATHLHMDAITFAQGNLIDTSAHRKALPQGYNLYRPLERSGDKAQSHRENLQMLLWPLYITSYCLWDLIDQCNAPKPKQVIVLSASSKTSLGLAYALKKDDYHVVGVTSGKSQGFVEGLDVYHQVVCYDDLDDIANKASIVVDMSGNNKVKLLLKNKLGDDLMRYVQVGLTHWQEVSTGDGTENTKDASGVSDEFFFAPAHIQTRMTELGAGVFHAKSGAFVKEAMLWTASWLSVREHENIASLLHNFDAICHGDVSPKEGLIFAP